MKSQQREHGTTALNSYATLFGIPAVPTSLTGASGNEQSLPAPATINELVITIVILASEAERGRRSMSDTRISAGGHIRNAWDAGAFDAPRWRALRQELMRAASAPALLGCALAWAERANFLKVLGRPDAAALRALAKAMMRFSEMTEAKAAKVGGQQQQAPRRRPKRRRCATARPLTKLQEQAIELLGVHEGKITAVADAMGISHPTAIQHVKAALRKLPGYDRPKLVKASKRVRLPLDSRGQVTVGPRSGRARRKQQPDR